MNISIPEPCHENWNEMTPTQKGKFCGSCQKEVTDFSKMTKKEIQNFFIEKASMSTCGRFEKRQLKEFSLPEVQNRPARNVKPWWIAAATFFLFANQGFSQVEPQVEHKNNLQSKNIPIATERPTKEKVDPGDEFPKDSLVYLSGQILDNNGDTLPFANVIIVGTNFKLGASTDLDGNFLLKIPTEFQDLFTIEIVLVGYLKKKISFTEMYQSRNIGEIRLEERSSLTKRFVVVEETQKIHKDSSSRSNSDSLVYLTGQILNENDEIIPFVTITIKETNLGVTSNIDGNFKLLIPKELQESFILEIKYLGYRKIEISYNELYKSKSAGIIKLEELDLQILGGVWYKPTPKDKVKSFFRKIFH